ncbi:hypothetical protein HY636_03095 [Candidatus Woesearchaeota archaeon]|nr:hypothetical protein [Candidatus Woesearchaeota archaeon]
MATSLNSSKLKKQPELKRQQKSTTQPELINENDLEAEMRKIGVDDRAVLYMLDKGRFKIIKLYNVRNAIANILKQEMLSIGGEVAVNKGCVNCTVPKSDVIVMGTIRQIKELIKKMKVQVSESREIALQLEKGV